MAKIKRARKYTKIDWRSWVFAYKERALLMREILFTNVNHRAVYIDAYIVAIMISWGFLDKVKHRTVAASNIGNHWIRYWRECDHEVK